MNDETIPLRWCHFHEGPEGPGVYVHVADLLALADTFGWEQVTDELGALLDERVDAASAERERR